MAAHGPRNRGDGALIARLLAGNTIADAASAAGVAERTARRRMQDARFRSRFDAAERELFAGTMVALVAASAGAVATLASLTDPSCRPATRLAASKALLELLLRWRACHEDARRGVAIGAPSLTDTRQATDAPPLAQLDS